MKKQDFAGIVVYVLILGLAIVFGVTVLQQYAPKSGLNTLEYIFFVIGALALGLVLNATIFELAHVVGAKIGRYNIVSVNIMYFCFYKLDGKWKFKFSGFDGLTGETKIVPKENVEKEPNPSPYLLFGTFFFAIEIIAIVVAFILLKDSGNITLSNIGYFLLISGVVGGLVLIYNIMPFQVDSITDGYRLTMTGNPKNKIAFNELLRVEHAISEGRADVEIKTFDQITNFTADLNLNKVYVLLDNHEYAQAEELLDIILAGKESISNKTYIRARAQKIYINIMSKSLEEAMKFYEEEVEPAERRLISNDVSMQSIRAYILMSALLDKSKSECFIALNNVYKAYKNTPKKRRKTEVMLYNEAVNKIIEIHPNWGLADYILVEED